MSKTSIRTAKMLIPQKQYIDKWAVVACDQYTSEPEYWEEIQQQVGDAPSTLKLILPEVYLESDDVDARISSIEDNMKKYIDTEVLHELPTGMMLVSRDTGGVCDRKGIVMAFDLECYDYEEGSKSLIRPTEKTVVERIPPRLKVRKDATLELPHIMILVDDRDRTVIEPLYEKRESLEKVYDVELMGNGGHLTGWFVPEGEITEQVVSAVEGLSTPEKFAARYDLNREYPFLEFAVGDGNHSMATAKAHWENIKKTLSEADKANHPARFVLAELVNIHDESIIIEAIYRVLFGVDCNSVLEAADEFFKNNAGEFGKMELTWYAGNTEGVITIDNSRWSMPVAALQAFLDDYLTKNKNAKIDYIHGLNTTKRIAAEPGNMGFYLPDPEKGQLFSGVVKDGVLPRKTFSMGDAREKRYYMEAKRIGGTK